MAWIRPRGLPALPRLSFYPELNVRTDVLHAEKPGVWFFSLDAASRVAVRVARRFFHVPWALQEAEAAIEVSTLAAGHGLALPAKPSLMHFARSISVATWPLWAV